MKYELRKKNRGGFAALISVIILSVVLLLIATTLSMTGFAGRLNILDSEYKERSLGLAEACVDTAILRLAQTPTYSVTPPGVVVPVGGDSCNIRSITPATDPIVIQATASFQNAFTNLVVNVALADLSIISWQEVANF